METRNGKDELEEIELRLLLEGVFQRTGYDFREYAPASLKRRIRKCMGEQNVRTISAFQQKVLHDEACMQGFLLTMSIDVTSMFRDPGFYLALRQKVVPFLRTYPFIRLWHAGCATGEEVYSLAILLKEEGLHERTRSYATDFNEAVLKEAKAGIFPLEKMKQYTQNYLQAGGSRSFSDYYKAMYKGAQFDPALVKNVVFAQHNLVTDASFNEFNLILCRNVMIYFNQALQNRVHGLFYESLVRMGFLGLGQKESLKFTPHEEAYQAVDTHEKLYQKTK